MATAQVSADLPKPSFAKVAASISTEKAAASTASRPIIQSKDQPPTKSHTSNPGPIESHPQATPPSQLMDRTTTGIPPAANKVAASLANLNIGPNVPSLVVDGSRSLAAARSQAMFSRASGSDDSQKADSSSELGTKPPSLDGKSITSGTTFALDEKESLRPDDSASVKAAAEDDDSLSIRGSLLAASRRGSDLAARARGIQLGDMPSRILAQPIVGAHGHGVLTPQSTSSEQPPSSSQLPLRSAGGSSDALNVIYRQAPDEKLLEALAAPRDRLFLLRLEKDVIDFVQDSKEPYMDLPPSNSFCRMLTHKLADYYHMTHSYEPHIGSVRIFRTPFCRVPPSLATMVPQPITSTSSTPPPAVLPRKIMRRGEEEEGTASAGASKTTSETGSDAKDKQALANQKLSREEREEMYKQARQRIFGNSEESPSENDGEYGMSRTSSVSANNKSSTSKKGKATKQRRDDSDSFDSRRHYTPYWGPQQQTWVPQPQAQFIPPAASQFNAQPAPAYPGQMPAVYGQQPPGYPAMPAIVPNTAYPAYPMPQYPSQPAQQRYPSNGSPMTAYGSPVLPSAPPPTQGWQPGYNPTAYQNRGSTPSGPSGPTGIPYAFGQLPVNVNPNDPKSQHPIPGSYNRNHAFNPKTQSFVPGGNNMPPVQPLQPPFTAPGSHHGSPQIGIPHLAYGGYASAVPPHSYAGGYNMVRQGSNNSMAAYHTPPPHITPPHIQHAPPMQNLQHIPSPQHLPQNQQVPTHVPSRPNIPQGPNQMFSSHLPNYGNLATLPQKPTTGI